jgi:hypothetical protein
MSEGDFVDAKKVASKGYLHLLQAPFGAIAAIEYRPDVPFWSGVVAGVAQAQILVAAFATAARRTMRISAMHQRRIVH